MKHFIPIVNDVENLLPKALNGCKNIWDRTYIIDNRDEEKEKQIDLNKIVDQKIKILKPISHILYPFILPSKSKIIGSSVGNKFVLGTQFGLG